MNTNLQVDRYFRSSSFYLSVFLFSKGLELVNIERFDPRKSNFVFRDVPEREFWVNQFNFASEDSPDVCVDVRKIVSAIKMLKDKLYQGNFGEGVR